MEEEFKRNPKTAFDVGFQLDLDGDRGGIIVQMPDGKAVPLEGDMVGALIAPFFAEVFQRQHKKNGRELWRPSTSNLQGP